MNNLRERKKSINNPYPPTSFIKFDFPPIFKAPLHPLKRKKKKNGRTKLISVLQLSNMFLFWLACKHVLSLSVHCSTKVTLAKSRKRIMQWEINVPSGKCNSPLPNLGNAHSLLPLKPCILFIRKGGSAAWSSERKLSLTRGSFAVISRGSVALCVADILLNSL